MDDIEIAYLEDTVIVKKISDEDMSVFVLSYDEFEELAFKIRQSPYGK